MPAGCWKTSRGSFEMLYPRCNHQMGTYRDNARVGYIVFHGTEKHFIPDEESLHPRIWQSAIHHRLCARNKEEMAPVPVPVPRVKLSKAFWVWGGSVFALYGVAVAIVELLR